MKGAHLNYVLEKLLAHELFHSWNGKHIVPAELYEPDLSQVVKSPNIWFVEGVTTYYEALSVYRAGEHKRQTFYSLITSFIQDGNVTESLEQMSIDSWKGLNPILYTKGALVALALDLKIRWAINNARSLDDVMRQMHDELAANSKQFTAESLRKFISKIAGENLDEFFARYVTGSERLDIDKVLSQAGLKLGFGKRKLAQDVGIFFNSNTILLGIFSIVALVIAITGVYGVTSYSVSQRRQEIGIRIALGAGRGKVLRLIVGQAMALAITGVAIGLVGAYILTRILAGQLFVITPTDSATYALVSVVLSCAVLAASYIPAYRAAKLDPAIVLRYE